MKKMNALVIENVKVGDLKVHPKNARQSDVGAIVQSLEAHGQYKPIVVQKSTMNVLAGNHTLMAARTLGWKEIAANVIDVDDDQALRILLVDNRASDLATYDENLLKDVLEALANENDFLDGTGYDGDDLDDLIFKLEGSEGFMMEGMSSDERREEYEAAGIRSIVCPYPEGTYNELIDMLADLRRDLNVDSNSEVFEALIRKAHANR